MKPTRNPILASCSPRAAKAKRAMRLPTAKAFAALPLMGRTLVFARWLKAQPPRKTYVYFDRNHCPLGTFARAIFRSKVGHGCNDSIRSGSASSIQVIPGFSPLSEALFYRLADGTARGSSTRTFGAASRAFQAALRA